MKVNENRSVTGVQGGGPVPDVKAVAREATGAATDKVSTDQGREVMRQIEAARLSVGGARSARLRDIESAVRSGAYKPNPGRVAEEILAAAEIDARIRAMLAR